MQAIARFAQELRQTVLAMNKSLGYEKERYVEDFHRCLQIAIGRPERMRHALWR